jgi:hypothetical protein
MNIGYLAFSWTACAENVVAEEIKWLKTFYPNLPEVKVKVSEETVESTIEKEDGSIVEGITCGLYYPKEMKIIIYAGSISKLVKGDYEAFRTKCMNTFSHEFQHHWQFTGNRKEDFINGLKKERQDNVKYLDLTIEQDARAAADWYVKRREKFTICF